MPNNNDLYQALINLGLPQLPEGYFYKFYVNDYEPSGYFGPKHENCLHADIRKKTFFGLFWRHIYGRYQVQEILKYSTHEDRKDMITLGFATAEELDASEEWLPQHLAYLGSEAFVNWQVKVRQEEALKAAKEKSLTRKIDQFLNKRIP